MRQKPKEFPGPANNLLLVEGAEDWHTIGHLCGKHNLTEPDRSPYFRLRESLGIDPLLKSLKVVPEESGLERLGIVIDSDHPPLDRYQSVRDQLIRHYKYTKIPLSPEKDGVIVQEPDKITIGIWVMPNNILRGELADFAALLVPENDPLWSHAENTIASLPEKDRPKPADGLNVENWNAKAKIHTWLAWRERPGQPIGEAIKQRYLLHDAETAQRFIAWIKRLFELE